MTYMDHIRSVALAGVAVIVEKTSTYGPSWKRRRGPGAWFTTVRPLDRLEVIVDRHDGDIFAAIAAEPEGADGSALACVRDLRNYFTLIEAEMIARGVVTPHTEFNWYSDPPTMGEEATPAYVNQDPPEPSVGVGRRHGSLVEAMAAVTEDASARLGAGPVADGCYTTLDIGRSSELWHVGTTALPSNRITGVCIEALRQMEAACERISNERNGALVASRQLVRHDRDGDYPGDYQIIIRIPHA